MDGGGDSLTWAEVPSIPANVPAFHTSITGATNGQFLRVATESGSKVVKYESVTIPSGNDLVPTITTDGYFLRSDVDGGGNSLTWAEVPTLPANVPNFHTAITGITDGLFLKVATESGSKVVKYESVTIPTNNNQLANGEDYITKDVTNQMTITNDTSPQLTIKPSSDSSQVGTLRIEGRRGTGLTSNSSAIEFYNYDNGLQTTSLYGRIVTRTESTTANVGKMRFQVSATGSTSTQAVLDLTSDRRALFLGDTDFANIPTHGSHTLLSTDSSLDYGKLTSVPSTFNPPEATSLVRGGIKIGYTQSGTTYPVQLSSEKAYVDINGFNSDLSDYSQSANVSIESTAGSVILKASVNAELRSINTDNTLTQLYTEGTNGHIYGITKNIQRLFISADARIDLKAENGIWLK